jgi:hypothetical protein
MSRNFLLSAVLWASALSAASESIAVELPATLSQTGLYMSGSAGMIAADVYGYTPQYPLWTDGATKRRWIRLPAGTSIDATDPDHWRFPVGTRLWKEFAFGRPIETRFMELQADGRWLFATYLWNEDATEASLAPERGVTAVPVGDGRVHDVPGRWDCRSCHGSRSEGVLGFSALQLSSDRDTLAVHAETPRTGDLDLDALIERGWIAGLPERARRPRIEAKTARERAVRGYFHGNCGSCHHDEGLLSVLALRLAHSIEADPFDPIAARVVVPGDPDASMLSRRMHSRDATMQMPPLGSRVADVDALALVDAWIREELAAHEASHRSEPMTERSARNPEERSR